MRDDAVIPSSLRQRVLVVEEDPRLRQTMTRALLRAGFEVFLAATGAAALLVARDLRLDAAIVDVFSPDAAGLGAAGGFRQTLGAVPVVFVTGLAIAAVRQALAPAPLLFRPLTRNRLLATLRLISPRRPGATAPRR